MFLIENLDFDIDGFSLKIDRLDLTNFKVSAIMGPSGAGKTTLFHTLIGIHQPANWSWLLNGRQMSQLKIEQRDLGVVFQNHELFPHLTARENVHLIMKSRGCDSQKDFQQLEKFKNDLQLESCWETKAEYLSGGESQRISLLRAVMSRPSALLLDEPFSALDVELRAEARRLTAFMVQQLDVPTLLITHDIEDARALNAHIVHLKSGRLV